MAAEPLLPLSGIRVIEFTHMVMYPTCGLILADPGAARLAAQLEAEGTPLPAAPAGELQALAWLSGVALAL